MPRSNINSLWSQRVAETFNSLSDLRRVFKQLV
jgi:hypothetical protein